MRKLDASLISKTVAQLCIEAACSLPVDVEKLLCSAMQKEESEFGRYALDKICRNIALARKKKAPLCQDTGMLIVFAEVGQDLHIVGASLEDAINTGVAQGYTEGYLRKSTVSDPLFNRSNTKDNTPAIIYSSLVDGDKLRLILMPKGAGAENMSRLYMLKPTEGVEGVKQAVIETVLQAGGNPCPPTIVGVGIGGNADMALMLSKKALLREAGSPNTQDSYAQLEEEILAKINESGIGPQGFGGRVTSLAVHIETFPTHIATLPVGVSLNCHAARHTQAIL